MEKDCGLVSTLKGTEYIRALTEDGATVRIPVEELGKVMAGVMPIVGLNNNGLLPSGRLVLNTIEFAPNESIEVSGQSLIFMNFGSGSVLALVLFAYWNYQVINPTSISNHISISLKSGNLFEIRNITNEMFVFKYSIIMKN